MMIPPLSLRLVNDNEPHQVPTAVAAVALELVRQEMTNKDQNANVSAKKSIAFVVFPGTNAKISLLTTKTSVLVMLI